MPKRAVLEISRGHKEEEGEKIRYNGNKWQKRCCVFKTFSLSRPNTSCPVKKNKKQKQKQIINQNEEKKTKWSYTCSSWWSGGFTASWKKALCFELFFSSIPQIGLDFPKPSPKPGLKFPTMLSDKWEKETSRVSCACVCVSVFVSVNPCTNMGAGQLGCPGGGISKEPTHQ